MLLSAVFFGIVVRGATAAFGFFLRFRASDVDSLDEGESRRFRFFFRLAASLTATSELSMELASSSTFGRFGFGC